MRLATMWRKATARCLLLVVLLILQLGHCAVAAESGDIGLLQQFQTRSPLDLRPRLSASQQTQILSDVQQHQQYSFPPSDAPFSTSQQPPSFSFPVESSTAFSSLARYKVDRKKQNQQIQHQLQQLQNLQHRIQQQQQQINAQFGEPRGEVPVSGQANNNNNYRQQVNNFQSLPALPIPSNQPELSQPFLSDVQLQEYYEKQRQLEILQRQREQLLLEQQELRRQQELLRAQQQQLRSTLLPSTTPAPATSSSVSSSTVASVLVASPTTRKITPSENDIFLRAIATHQKKFASTPRPTTSATQKAARQERVQDSLNEQAIPKDLLALIQAQQNQAVQAGKPRPQIKVIYQTEKPEKAEKPEKSAGAKAKPASEKELLLKQLKIALAQSGLEDSDRNVTTRDIVLPNGKKLQVIHAPNGLPSNGPTTTIKPPKAIFEELTKGGVLPPGADFEVLRHNHEGKLEELGKNVLQNPPAKKVTFVVLEEQPDGSYKVQGVKGNAEKDSGTDVDSIVERIKKGEIKLPPSSTKQPSSPSTTTTTTTKSTRTTTASPYRTHRTQPVEIGQKSLATTFRPTLPTTRTPHVSVSPNSLSLSDKYVTSASSISGHVLNSISTTAKPAVSHVPLQYPSSSVSSREELVSSTTPSSFLHSSTYVASASPATRPPTPPPSRGTTYAAPKDNLSNLLRREGLFAMAKYLRQSGLDSVLNETGPYTIFVPTDKAFRTLLVQLGGPEKAEQKFRENPRLLSGLLLHHVVPGAFRIESLQDEMTGVSLAGTQLRVNVYSMHDHEWNDIKVTTVNGARIAPNKRDVDIPQGLAHAIDRVMFPLPVGDLVQTLQADRERRFSTFLKLLHASGLEAMLSGTKTFTVFAPTDAAFVEAATKNGGTPAWQEADGVEAAKEIVLRHVIPTSLYTAGMRYYHQKESLRQQAPIQLQKTGGRIRVNEGHIITYNVPATNGVLHAIDTVM